MQEEDKAVQLVTGMVDEARIKAQQEAARAQEAKLQRNAPYLTAFSKCLDKKMVQFFKSSSPSLLQKMITGNKGVVYFEQWWGYRGWKPCEKYLDGSEFTGHNGYVEVAGLWAKQEPHRHFECRSPTLTFVNFGICGNTTLEAEE